MRWPPIFGLAILDKSIVLYMETYGNSPLRVKKQRKEIELADPVRAGAGEEN